MSHPHLRRPVRTRCAVVALSIAALVTAACGSPMADPAGGAAANPCAGSAALNLVERTANMPVAERQSLLEGEAVAAAGGSIDLYTELNDPQPIVNAFQKKHPDLTVNVYRAGSEQIRQRVLEESAANFSGADVVEMDSLEMAILDENKLLAPASSPMIGEVSEAARFPRYTGDRLSYIVPLWNTNLLAPGDVPKSLEDLADPRFKGKLALESSDVFWFAGLVKYLEREQGKTKDEAVDVFRKIAANASITSGHTTTTELVVAGQYAIAANNFIHRALELQGKGAPLGWAPVQVPVVAEITAVSLPCLSNNPAGALLLQDFLLSADGAQPIFVQEGRTPSNSGLAQQTLGGQKIEPVKVDVAEVAAEYKDWAALWDEVIRGGTQG
jgi:iron(III) transport system substrate-binding protein